METKGETKEALSLSMQNWTHDVPVGTRADFLAHIEACKPRRLLEIGVFEGTSALALIREALRYRPDAHLLVVDPWEALPSAEFTPEQLAAAKATFEANFSRSGLRSCVSVREDSSQRVLLDLLRAGASFDFIYVDGSHRAFDVYFDLVLAWELLLPGGTLAIDDVGWLLEAPVLERPCAAVQHFEGAHMHEFDMPRCSPGYRHFLVKKQ